MPMPSAIFHAAAWSLADAFRHRRKTTGVGKQRPYERARPIQRLISRLPRPTPSHCVRSRSTRRRGKRPRRPNPHRPVRPVPHPQSLDESSPSVVGASLADAFLYCRFRARPSHDPGAHFLQSSHALISGGQHPLALHVRSSIRAPSPPHPAAGWGFASPRWTDPLTTDEHR